jgi:hypothetical protein
VRQAHGDGTGPGRPTWPGGIADRRQARTQPDGITGRPVASRLPRRLRIATVQRLPGPELVRLAGRDDDLLVFGGVDTALTGWLTSPSEEEAWPHPVITPAVITSRTCACGMALLSHANAASRPDARNRGGVRPSPWSSSRHRGEGHGTQTRNGYTADDRQ